MQGLYLSGFIKETIGPRGFLENGRWFIQKPFTPAALLEKVRRALEA
jgi:hypothetical protein